VRERGRERAAGGWLATVAGALLLVVVGFGVGLLAGSLFEEPELVAKQLAGEATEVPLPEAGPAQAPAPVPGNAPPEPAPGVAAGEATKDFQAGDEAEAGAAAEAERALEVGGPRAAPAPEEVPHAGARPERARPADAARAPVGEAPSARPPAVSARPPAEPPRAPAPDPEPPAAREGFAVQVGAFGERAAADRLVASLRGDRFPAYVALGKPGEAARFRVRVGPFRTRDEASRHAGRLKERRKLPTWVIREGGT